MDGTRGDREELGGQGNQEEWYESQRGRKRLNKDYGRDILPRKDGHRQRNSNKGVLDVSIFAISATVNDIINYIVRVNIDGQIFVIKLVEGGEIVCDAELNTRRENQLLKSRLHLSLLNESEEGVQKATGTHNPKWCGEPILMSCSTMPFHQQHWELGYANVPNKGPVLQTGD
ncbi:hypothetical protein VNO78_15836 [Psophocarpus tetragonolobus]|uniref:Uncharacterized protein n=1 Tax=Psophocarpus tetragonolobus TaxID=3891 RepID=A0AAN9SFN4_PSOTE